MHFKLCYPSLVAWKYTKGRVSWSEIQHSTAVQRYMLSLACQYTTCLGSRFFLLRPDVVPPPPSHIPFGCSWCSSSSSQLYTDYHYHFHHNYLFTGPLNSLGFLGWLKIFSALRTCLSLQFSTFSHIASILNLAI